MSYLKFTADYIFTGYEIISGKNSVLITHENGKIEATVPKEKAGDGIQTFNGILTPGFINCHCHLELSHLKKVIPPNTGLIPFLISVPKYREANFETIQNAIENAITELYNSGTVAVGDICNNTTTISIKKNSNLHFYNFIEAIGFQDSNAESRFNLYENVYNLFKTELSNQLNSIVPHAPYSVSKKLFELINLQSSEKTICIHNQETIEETKWFKNKEGEFINLFNALQIDSSSFIPSGKSSLQTYLPHLTNVKNIILVHNSFTTYADIEFALHHAKKFNQNIFWCICNNANLYIEQTSPPIKTLKDQNCTLVIGTDSYSSNWSLNMLDEIKTILQSSNNNYSTSEVLQWATINGATALQMQSHLGSFDTGKIPGIVLIENTINQSIIKESTTRRII